MVRSGFDAFNTKNVLLLQGPVGPFFKYLARDLKDAGARVHQICFNGGDWYFASDNAIRFTGAPDEWPDFFTDFIRSHAIDIVLLFGDCRSYHRIAHTIAINKGVDIGVFEEGYLRPDYITFERFGVNGFSQLPRNREFYDTLSAEETEFAETLPVGNTFWCAAWHATMYYFFSAVLYLPFRRYQHHRPLNVWEGTYWIRSLWRKWLYRIKESGTMAILKGEMSNRFFLVPLQVSTDAQVREHSFFGSVEHFLEKVLASFATHAPSDTWLVVKHHPMDRGYHDYSVLIKRLAAHYGVKKRVLYIHDQHLPTLLDHARGVVLINSTVGLSAIHHHAPTKACGTAIYNMEGLTYSGGIDTFWKDAENFEPDQELYERFKGYVIRNKQINGSFYRRLHGTHTHTGTVW